ncbi:MAG: flagellar assembly protein FliW [Clostridiales bacterium]|jgi:flagellar assembly factor FliW|nr:flagellar assembly protein FliW [Clostridiales bacterium]
MILPTQHFGEIEISEEQIITFEGGLPGFPEDLRFIIIEDGEPESPFCWLQSVDDTDTCFILMDVFSSNFPDYAPELLPEEVLSLGEFNKETAKDFLIYNIVVLPEDSSKMSVNLLAPVLINQAARRGAQLIAQNADEKGYTVRHYILGADSAESEGL